MALAAPLLLAGCGWFGASPAPVVSDPPVVVYPPLAEGGRYMPWRGGWRSPQAASLTSTGAWSEGLSSDRAIVSTSQD